MKNIKMYPLALMLLACTMSLQAGQFREKNQSQKNEVDKNSITVEAITDTSLATISKNGSGVVKFFKANIIVINNRQYNLAKNYKIYDGEIKKKSNVRFLLNNNQEILEMWVMK